MCPNMLCQSEDKLGCWSLPSVLSLPLCTLSWPPASRESAVPTSHLSLEQWDYRHTLHDGFLWVLGI